MWCSDPGDNWLHEIKHDDSRRPSQGRAKPSETSISLAVVLPRRRNARVRR